MPTSGVPGSSGQAKGLVAIAGACRVHQLAHIQVPLLILSGLGFRAQKQQGNPNCKGQLPSYKEPHYLNACQVHGLFEPAQFE